jgi:AcrR family transcriptional regulator
MAVPARKSAAMQLKPPSSETAAERKQTIVRALHRCIREHGYARTTLTDIALKAEMSPSHIRYYFDGKEAILKFYFEMLCHDIVSEIRRIPFHDPEQWLCDFARYYFGNPRISQTGLAVIVEIFGVAMHDAGMKAIKIGFDNEMRAILRRFFEQAGCAEGLTPETAAELARAMDIGLKYSTAFCETKPETLEAMVLAGIRLLMQSGSRRAVRSRANTCARPPDTKASAVRIADDHAARRANAL